MVLAKGQRFYWRIRTSTGKGAEPFREKDKGGFMKHICDLLALPGFVGKRMGRGMFCLWGRAMAKMISSVPEEFASVLWWRAGLCRRGPIPGMDWPGMMAVSRGYRSPACQKSRTSWLQAIGAGRTAARF